MSSSLYGKNSQCRRVRQNSLQCLTRFKLIFLWRNKCVYLQANLAFLLSKDLATPIYLLKYQDKIQKSHSFNIQMLTVEEGFSLEQNFGSISYIQAFPGVSLIYFTVTCCTYILIGQKQIEGKIEQLPFKLIRMKHRTFLA